MLLTAKHLRLLTGTMEENQTDSKTNIAEGSVPTSLNCLRINDYRRSFEKERVLPSNYQVKVQDVICGNHRVPRGSQQHVGNERFRVVVEIRLQRYSKAARAEKSEIVREIVDSVRDYGGRFVRCDEGKWNDIGSLRAREKAGHAIRGSLLKLQLSNKTATCAPLRVRSLPQMIEPSSTKKRTSSR